MTNQVRTRDEKWVRSTHMSLPRGRLPQKGEGKAAAEANGRPNLRKGRGLTEGGFKPPLG